MARRSEIPEDVFFDPPPSDKEKRDINNVMAACKLGCDDLFEKGYVTVRDALIVAEQPSVVTERVRKAVADLESRRVNGWSELNQPYFEWHRRSVVL